MNRSAVKSLPAGMVGAVPVVYAALQEIAAETSADAPAGAWFRNADLATRTGYSPTRVGVALRWLRDHGHIEIASGSRGRLNHATFNPAGGAR